MTGRALSRRLDSDLTNYSIEDSDGGGITATETGLDWTDALGNNNTDRVHREFDDVSPVTNFFEIVIDSFVGSKDSTFDAFISGFTVNDNLLDDEDFIGMIIGDGGDGVDNLAVYIINEGYGGTETFHDQDAATQVSSTTFGAGDTQSISIDYDFVSGSITVHANGDSETQSFDETKDWSWHQVIATMSAQEFNYPGANSGKLTDYSFSDLS